ncbi:MAG TPA: polyprenyl synthetase family protein [Planctomycetaceae bacterium]|jgi:octaprenyl-diphosphate synthase|nr:polyprenyl synthetase family protein [Planctomycetaceae bacterium]
MGGRDLAGLPSRVERFIGSDLLKVEQIFHTELASPNPYVADIFTHVAHFRGKRLRPMLLLLSASATGPIAESHRVLAAVVEMIHTATLVHDDVLDEAETRRHVATVNTRWNNETSVLFGDYLFTHAFHLASSLETTLACRLIGRATNIVCEGELTQIRERGNLELSEEAYLRIIDGKTAELCAVSCYLGAHYAEAEESISKSLEQYGRALGIAFQISDDLLDILGSEDETGKSLGTDFKKQKLTLPLIRLLSQTEEPESVRLRELIAQADDEAWSEVVRWLHRSDAVEYSRARALEFAAAARSHLQDLNDSSAKRILLEITEFATHRTY